MIGPTADTAIAKIDFDLNYIALITFVSLILSFRAFCVSSPNDWNSLPLNIRSSDSLATFQSRLKSYLFASAYHV